jgi:type III pantothenate kinase
VNVGNTTTRIARFEGGTVVADERVSTLALVSGAPPPDISPGLPIVIVSVVPVVTRVLQQTWADRVVFVAELGAARGMAIAYDPPEALGADRLVNAFALMQRVGHGIVIDFGTATTLTVVLPGGVLRGGAILPGLSTAMASLDSGTAQLPEVKVAAPGRVIGGSTRESIEVGVVLGQAGAVRYLVERMLGELPPDSAVIITGGWATLMAPLLPDNYMLEPNWTLEGARLMYLCSTRSSG